MTATIAPNAIGTLSNTATVTGADDTTSGNNSSTDTTDLDVQYDLSIVKTDGQLTDVAGTSISYLIVVSNAGPSAATNVVVADLFPPTLTDITWTSVRTTGVRGNSTGSGNLNDTIDFIPAGGTVTYTVTATIDPAATGTLSNTATVSGADDTASATTAAPTPPTWTCSTT